MAGLKKLGTAAAVFFLGITLASGTGLAQNNDNTEMASEIPLELNLDGAFKLALKNNPGYYGKVLELEGARLNLEKIRSTEKGWGSEIAISEAEDQLHQAELAVTMAEKDLNLKVSEAYYQALAAEIQFKTASKYNLLGQGEILAQRQKDLNLALLNLRQVAGLSPSQAVQLNQSEFVFREARLNEDLLIRRAMLADQEILNLRKDLAVAQREVEVAVAKNKPASEMAILMNRRAVAEMRLRQAETAITFRVDASLEETRYLGRIYAIKATRVAEKKTAGETFQALYQGETEMVQALAAYLSRLSSLEILLN